MARRWRRPARRSPPPNSTERKLINVARPPAMRASPAAVIQFVTLGVTNGALGAKRTRSDAGSVPDYDHKVSES
ncbi:hypothetical protein Ari01nite_65610 [Paractinoplanes rishiriensis]|uniref:Uncharacterized protein n=1 Tax=Paractinoplanes rishiriensis TaxID=1050105 RepID=A0A919MTB5_9ACTN|nr:hypothetical protein Ari01nite_65610 [Actinoplanes rishiriensis]